MNANSTHTLCNPEYLIFGSLWKMLRFSSLEEMFRHRLARRVERAAGEKLFADDQIEPRLMYFVQVHVNRARVYFHEHFIDAYVGVEPAALRAPFATFAVNF